MKKKSLKRANLSPLYLTQVRFKSKKMNIKTIWDNKASIIKGAKNNIVRTKAIEDLAAARLAICDACPHKSKDCAPLIKHCCALCGCSLAWKTRVPEQACPDNRWPSLNIE